DSTELSHWRPLRTLLSAMDDDIATIYAERGIADIRPRFTLPLIKLGRHGPLTIRQLADATVVTHSAMSQTVTSLRRAGLVRTTPGSDARTRKVALTKRARAVVPFLEAEWRATEEAVAQLEDEIPYRLTQVVSDLEVALARRSFQARIEQILRETSATPR
ncbi:MAG: MarR family winged helix-turn-helix transcriptional regulator, partial [Nocardioidaceae bacterium]